MNRHSPLDPSERPSSRRSSLSPAVFVSMLRPHHWVKNLLIFVPLGAAHANDLATWWAANLCFVCFCAVVSAGYIANDLMDLHADRSHARKSQRAVASGLISKRQAVLVAIGLATAGLGLGAMLLPLGVAFALTLYLAGTLAYSWRLKRVLMLDIATIAGLHLVRLFAGGEAAAIEISHWLLAFALFFFLGLAAVKRLAELTSTAATHGSILPGRAYRGGDEPALLAIAAGAGFVSILVMALFLNDVAATGAYAEPTFLWGICIVLAVWIGRVIILAARGQIAQDPIVFGLTDFGSWLALAIIANCFALAMIA
ncbi:MAG: UbiA family prenyltransferase [Pseudomonadota bacterium]